MLMMDPSPGRDHRLGDVLRAEARTLQVDIQDMVPVTLCHLEEGDARKYPRVVDQNVDGAEPILDGRHHGLNLLYLAHVRSDQDLPPSAGAYLIGDALGSSLVVEPIDRHVGASRGKLQRHRAADALLRPGYQNHLASEIHVEAPISGRVDPLIWR